MANQWFRMCAEFATDPKVRLLGNAVCPPVAADLIQAIREAA